MIRSFIFLFCFTAFAFTPKNGFTQNEKILIDQDKTYAITEIFELIINQTDYNFIYAKDLFEADNKITLKKGVIRASKLLNRCLEKTAYTYDFTNDKTIILVKKNKAIKKPQQEEFTMSGKIIDKSGNPLPGITVYITEQNPLTVGTPGVNSGDFVIRGTSTDFDGSYSIRLKPGDFIAITGIGFKFYMDQIMVQTETYDVTLEEEISELEEVVLIGYGQQTRKEVTGAISSVRAEDISKNSIGNQSFDRALSGLLKGVNIVQNNGRPGAGVDINVRGITSPFASGSDNNPLFVIDGVPFQTNPANNLANFGQSQNPLLAINPNDIESIDVLKDAAATAIYGSRGANGVILVKTKTGKKNQKNKIRLSTTTTFARPIAERSYLGTEDWRVFVDNFFSNSVAAYNTDPANSGVSRGSLFASQYAANISGDPDTFSLDPIGYNGLVDSFFGNTNTNWADVIYRDPAHTQQYDLSLSGGNQNTTYYISLLHSNQEGLVKGDKFKRYNVRTSIDSDISKTLKLGLTSNIGYTDSNSGFQREDLNRILNTRPDVSVFDENGEFLQYTDAINEQTSELVNHANPLAKTTGFSNEGQSFTLIGNMYAEAKLFKGFKLRYDINISRFNTKNRLFEPVAVVRGTPISSFFALENANLNLSESTNTNIISNITSSYDRVFNAHKISAILGFSWDRSKTEILASSFSGFPDTSVLISASNAKNRLSTQDQTIDSGLNSIFSRLAYNYNNKYYVTANFRTDKSSRFGPNNQRAYFPSVSASWDIANEKFLINNDIINNLRLRFGIGRTGSNNIGNFRYLQFFNSGEGLDGLYGGIPSVELLGTLPNPDVKWEITDETNIGLNYELFNNRLRGSIDVYNRKTTGALIPGFFPLETGASDFIANFADLTNKGFEIDLGGDIINSSNFKWTANFNISKNKNTLDKFVSEFIDEGQIDSYEVGREVNLIRGYEVEYIFQDQTEIDGLNATADDGFYQEPGTGVGDYKYRDINGDGEITLDDRKILGSSQPDFFGGFNTSFEYKGFQLSAFFNYSVGGEAWDLGQLNASNINLGPLNNILSDYADVWTPTNTDAQYPRAILSDPNDNTRLSDRNVYKTSFVRLKTLQLNYAFPQSILSHIGFSGANIFVSASNLWTSTDFPGIDPESVGPIAGTSSTRGQNFYPIAKTWSVGLNMNF
ncbi:SusC/RagA family TonB-linked outer membrane protein [Flavivirga eckloniae]|nr:SusC/RagA family TonB-linked outer membrane protein [Flavivirga eckloniae]